MKYAYIIHSFQKAFIRKLKVAHPAKGFTLYEMLMYIALFLLLSVLVTGLVIQLLQTGFRMGRSREVLTSVGTAYQAIFEEARFAQSVYDPTSAFSSDSGQVSFETAADPPSGETATYGDFYMDNGRIFLKKESRQPQALTSERVRGTTFLITRLNPIATSESLRISIAAEHRFAPGGEDSSFSATSSITLRRY